MSFEIQKLDIANNDNFFAQLANLQGATEKPRPVRVRLNGKTGEWTEAKYSEAEKKLDHIPWKGGSNPWQGTILMVKYYAKEKYKDNATIVRRTREFTWDEPIELIKIDYGNKENGTQTIASYNDYKAFKDALGHEYANAVADAIKNKQAIPKQDDFTFDLWSSIYFYDFESNRICNLQVKGLSRKAVFDYLSAWKRGVTDVHSFSQVLTNFESVHHTEPLSFYALRLTTDSVLAPPYQAKIKEAIMALGAWMQSFKTNEIVQTPIATETVVDDIDLSSIPF